MQSTIAQESKSTKPENKLSEDEIFNILSNRRRRFVIHALKRTEEPIDISELSRQIKAWEAGIEPAEVSYEGRRSVHSTLKRIHLPTLEEKNIVIVDEDNNLVQAAPVLDDLDIYTEVLEGNEIPWSLYYLGLATLDFVLFIAVVSGATAFANFGVFDVAVFSVTTFGISSIAHHILNRRARLGNTERPPERRKRE